MIELLLGAMNIPKPAANTSKPQDHLFNGGGFRHPGNHEQAGHKDQQPAGRDSSGAKQVRYLSGQGCNHHQGHGQHQQPCRLC